MALAPGSTLSVLPGGVAPGGTGAVCAYANAPTPRLKQAADMSNFLPIRFLPLSERTKRDQFAERAFTRDGGMLEFMRRVR